MCLAKQSLLNKARVVTKWKNLKNVLNPVASVMPNREVGTAGLIAKARRKPVTVDPSTHNVYLFQPERAPAPQPPAGTPPAEKGGRGRGPQGPIVAAWFIVIKQ